ncbi:MAG: hypothetical protein JWO30_2315 [Fibrobacteres bacterium]|nr:hypothetical protein [Fibrobacterota bacterium]
MQADDEGGILEILEGVYSNLVGYPTIHFELFECLVFKYDRNLDVIDV